MPAHVAESNRIDITHSINSLERQTNHSILD
ncbi:MAG: CRISPR-associated DxTHG motif protein [Crocinitomicaceae bacterium]|nr:CRISPR-associated DxTHG motif protein [Crocinitomicaceae bacterium]